MSPSNTSSEQATQTLIDGLANLKCPSACFRSLRRRDKDIFEELEKEEDNVDKMIDEYVSQQIEEQKNPKEKPKPKPRDPNAPPRKKRRKRTPSPEQDPEEEGGRNHQWTRDFDSILNT